jgi:hypothetical protein
VIHFQLLSQSKATTSTTVAGCDIDVYIIDHNQKVSTLIYFLQKYIYGM